MKKTVLQVFLNGQWRYVFCRNERQRDPVTTDDKKKALGADAMEYFQGKYGNHEFRLERY